MVTSDMLAMALETILKHVTKSTDLHQIQAVYIPPAEQLRRQAANIERKDWEIETAKDILDSYKKQLKEEK